MLRTPTSFVSLLVAQDHPNPLNFVFCGDELLVRESDLSLPGSAALADLRWPDQRFHPVGILDSRYCRAGWIERGAIASEGHAFRRLRSMFGAMDESLLAVAGRAFQIANWARTHRFCGACGAPTIQLEGERCAKCPACHFMAYPRISPAMHLTAER